MPEFLTNAFRAAQNPESTMPAIILVWTVLGAAVLFLVWPRGRTLARQLYALAALGFREGLRLKVLWTVLLLSLLPGGIAFFWQAGFRRKHLLTSESARLTARHRFVALRETAPEPGARPAGGV